MEAKKPKHVLYNFPLKEVKQISGLEIIRMPWKEADKAALMGLKYEQERIRKTEFYVAVYDQFTENAWASREPFEPFLLSYMAINCNPDLDKEYEAIIGNSLRKLNRAKTSEERMKIAGIIEKDIKKTSEDS